MNYIILSIPVFFILIGVEVLISYLKGSGLYRLNDAVSNISCGIMQQVTGALAKTALVIGYIILYDHARVFTMPDTWWVYLLLFIGIDFFYYWFHRLSHEVNILWGAHIVHHQSEEYNLSVALRQSSLQGFFSMVFYLPLAILGFNPVVFVTINAFQTLYQFWIHTKTIDRLHPVFEYVMNTPSHHRVHHGRNPKYIDKNHGGTLIIFDRLFGTFQAEEEEVVYGVTKPLSSWNPLWANLDYYVDMWSDLKMNMTWGERIKYLFALPGWLPERLGGYRAPGEITVETATKYNTTISPQLNVYVLAQYLFVLLFTTGLLFNTEAEWMTRPIMLMGSAWIVWSIVNIGSIFEARRWSTISEILRWVFLIALSLLVSLSMWLTVTCITFGGLSLIFFLSVSARRVQES